MEKCIVPSGVETPEDKLLEQICGSEVEEVMEPNAAETLKDDVPERVSGSVMEQILEPTREETLNYQVLEQVSGSEMEEVMELIAVQNPEDEGPEQVSGSIEKIQEPTMVENLKDQMLEQVNFEAIMQNMLRDKNTMKLAFVFTLTDIKQLLQEALWRDRAEEARSLLQNMTALYRTQFLDKCNQDADFRAMFHAALKRAFVRAIYKNQPRMMHFLMKYVDETLMEGSFIAEFCAVDIHAVVYLGRGYVLDTILPHCREAEHRSLMAEAILKSVAVDIKSNSGREAVLRRFLKHAKKHHWKDVFTNPTYVKLVQDAVHLQLVDMLYDMFEFAKDQQIESALQQVDVYEAIRAAVTTDNSAMLCVLLDFTTGKQKELMMKNFNLMDTVKNSIREGNAISLKSLMRAASQDERRTVFDSDYYMEALQRAWRDGHEDMFCSLMAFTSKKRGKQLCEKLGIPHAFSHKRKLFSRSIPSTSSHW